jgi:hypothetical protein
MKVNKHASLNELLGNDYSKLGQLAQKSRALAEINQQLQNVLAKELKGKCNVANLRANCLVIAVESANWLTYLRYNRADILSKLQKQPGLNFIQELKFIIVSDATHEISNRTVMRDGSTVASEDLASTARNIEDDELKAALLKLSKTLGK